MRRLVALLILLVHVAPTEGADSAWGWLGIRIRDLSEQEMDEISKKYGLREGFGVYVVEVMKETPAEGSGLQPGDLIVAFRDRPVVDTRTLQRLIAHTASGDTIGLTVLRREEGRRRLSVRIGVMPDAIPAESPAERAGLQVGDTLVEVNGRPVLTLEAAREALLAASLERPLSLVVRRASERVALVLKTSAPKL